MTLRILTCSNTSFIVEATKYYNIEDIVESSCLPVHETNRKACKLDSLIHKLSA